MSSLTSKLIMGFLLVALTVAGLTAVFIRRSNTRQFSQLLQTQAMIDLQERLVDHYLIFGTLEGIGGTIRAEPRPPQPQNNNGARGNQNNNGPRRDPPRGEYGVADENGLIVVPLQGVFNMGEKVPAFSLQQGTPVTADNQIIATILTRNTPALTAEEQAYINRTNQAVLTATGISVVFAILISLFLARTLLRPVRDLTQASQAMAQGKLDQQVQVRSRDEIGQLATAFNQMSADLARSKAVRQQMTADIAHDLRSPLQVLAGYIESMRDGVLAPTPDRFDLLYDEVEHLQHLVTDLRTLSQADAGELPLNLQTIRVADLLNRILQSYQHSAIQAAVQLQLDVVSELPTITVDEERMVQVLGNLVSNALRYTPKNGRISLIGKMEGKRVRLGVQDNGAGISATDLPHIFDRFYRADPAREAESSGLGLAIAKALVEAHGGTLSAESELGAGTVFWVDLGA